MQTADEFMVHAIDLAPARVAEVVRTMAAMRRKPRQTTAEMLEQFRTLSNLEQSAEVLRAQV